MFGNADAGIVDIDPDFRPFAAAADQNAPAGLRIPDRIGQEIAQNATEQHGIARDMDIGRNSSKIDPPLDRGIFVFVAKLPKQRPKPDRRNLQSIRTFS